MDAACPISGTTASTAPLSDPPDTRHRDGVALWSPTATDAAAGVWSDAALQILTGNFQRDSNLKRR